MKVKKSASSSAAQTDADHDDPTQTTSEDATPLQTASLSPENVDSFLEQEDDDVPLAFAEDLILDHEAELPPTSFLQDGRVGDGRVGGTARQQGLLNSRDGDMFSNAVLETGTLEEDADGPEELVEEEEEGGSGLLLPERVDDLQRDVTDVEMADGMQDVEQFDRPTGASIF